MSGSPQPEFVELVLTCPSWQEAERIGEQLLKKRLVACVQYLEIKSSYHWKGSIEGSKEIKLIMQSLDKHFKEIEKEVTEMHSYNTFVLQQIPLTNISSDARDWLASEVKKLTN